MKEVLCDDSWIYTAATVIADDENDTIIVPSSAGLDDLFAGGYLECFRDAPRTFQEAAQKDHKALQRVKAIPEEFQESDYFFEDHRQYAGEQSTIYSEAPI